MAAAGLGGVYGGGSAGMMGIFADALLAAGGEVHGVIPGFMVELELAHKGLTKLHVVKDMAERKALMTVLSWAFVVLPGGVGTLDELFEMMTARQLGLQPHPVGFLNTGGYFDPLLQQLQLAEQHGYIDNADLTNLRVEGEADALLKALSSLAGPTEP